LQVIVSGQLRAAHYYLAIAIAVARCGRNGALRLSFAKCVVFASYEMAFMLKHTLAKLHE